MRSLFELHRLPSRVPVMAYILAHLSTDCDRLAVWTVREGHERGDAPAMGMAQWSIWEVDRCPLAHRWESICFDQ